MAAAPNATEVVFLDANVLYSVTLTDLYLTLHGLRACRVAWSTYVEDEALRSLSAGSASGADRAGYERRFGAMRGYASTPYGPLRHLSATSEEIALRLPDPDDVPVATDAVAVGATRLITFNLRDFPAGRLAPFGLTRASPDFHLSELLDVDAGVMMEALRLMASKRRRPPTSPETTIDKLRRAGCRRTARRLAP